MPTSQYDKHTLHCVLGSVSSNSHSSMFPTSWIICFDSWLGLNVWLCCRSRWRACRFGWFSIFWINSRTLALCNCFTIECGSPGILKSMSSSILSRINSLLMLSILISWCSASLRLSSCPDLSWVCSTPTFLFSSDGHVWTPITSCVISSCPDLSEEQSSSWKDSTSISWERDVSPLTTNTPCVLSGCPYLSQIGFGIRWVGWKNFARLATSSCDCRTTSPSGCWSTVEPNGTSPLAHSCFSEIFGGGRGDMYAFSYKTSPVFNLTTFGIQ